jgi:hypothetical protein
MIFKTRKLLPFFFISLLCVFGTGVFAQEAEAPVNAEKTNLSKGQVFLAALKGLTVGLDVAVHDDEERNILKTPANRTRKTCE